MTIYCEKPQKPEDSTIFTVNIPQAHVKKGNQWFDSCSTQYLLVVVLLVASMLASLTTLVLFLTKHNLHNNEIYDQPMKDLPIQQTLHKYTTTGKPDLDESSKSITPTGLAIVTRREWVAQPPAQQMAPLHLPAPYVIIMHTATENCSDAARCTVTVRAIQSYHIESRGFNDIGYNFLIGGDAKAYEGRGWQTQGAHTYGYNSKSVGIAFIGNFNSVLPTKEQIFTAHKLIDFGVQKGYIAANYKLFAARQLQATQSPGLMLFENMKSWPHWTEAETSRVD